MRVGFYQRSRSTSDPVSILGSNVRTMTSKSIGKRRIDPYISETPEKFITKIECFDYVLGCNDHANFYGNRPRGVRLTNS